MSFTLLDGGMGQELIARMGRLATPLWSADVIRDQPDLVEDTHADFLKAGADVITVSAYSVTPSRLARAGRDDEFATLQKKALGAARRARDRINPQARIAGCLPPLPGSYRPADRLSAERTADEYAQIVAIQADWVELFLCETLGSIEEALLATKAAHGVGLPVWTAVTVDELDGTVLRSGEPVTAAAEAAFDAGAQAVLINCSPPEATEVALHELLTLNKPVGAYANGFTTVAPLQADTTVDLLTRREDLGPEAFADYTMRLAEAGASILGGCCEISPRHIEEISRRRQRSFPRAG